MPRNRLPLIIAMWLTVPGIGASGADTPAPAATPCERLAASVIRPRQMAQALPVIPRALVRCAGELLVFHLPAGFEITRPFGPIIVLENPEQDFKLILSCEEPMAVGKDQDRMEVYRQHVVGRLPGADVMDAFTLPVMEAVSWVVDLQWGGPARNERFQRSVLLPHAGKFMEFRLTAPGAGRERAQQALNLILLTLQVSANGRVPALETFSEI